MIGAGLFAGSGGVIHETGPAAFLWPIPESCMSSTRFPASLSPGSEWRSITMRNCSPVW